MKAKLTKLITDITAFDERVSEILGDTSLDTIRATIADIKDWLYANPTVPALCAPQLGINLRLFVVRTANIADNRFKIFLNPMIVQHEKEVHLSRESNPCFPNKEFIIPRFDKIHVAYQELLGQPTSESFFGAYGEVVQQMIEMLDGVTLFDNGLDLDDVGGVKAFDKASKKAQQEVIQMYLDNYCKKAETLKQEIADDPELDKLNKSIDLMTGLIEGNIKPLDENGNEVTWNPFNTDNTKK